MLFLTIIFVFLTVISFGMFIYLLLDKYSPWVNFKVKWNNNIVIISLFLLTISSLFLAFTNGITSYIINNIDKITDDYTKAGALGDLIGGILNPAVAFVGIIAASLAFYAQYRANQQVQKQFRIQQFESQFYEMLRLHKENVNEMKITGYGLSMETTEERDNKDVVSKTIEKETQTVRITQGRKVFVTMITELIALYELLEFYNERYHTSIAKEELLRYAYKLFFFGVKSEVPTSDIIGELTMDTFKRHLINVKRRHKSSYGKNNIIERSTEDFWMSNVELFIKYSPFSGHESRLGHYYRHLYSTVKYIVNQDGKLLTYREVRRYLKVLRSQMSNDEQLMLYYNYRIGFGGDWEKKGFLTKYRMLHNLPIGKVKYVENPRDHFSDFIRDFATEEDPLFEWGDYGE